MWKKYVSNLLVNDNWVISGIELIGVALFFEYRTSYIRQPRVMMQSSIWLHIDDPYIPVLLVMVGTLAIITAVFDLRPIKNLMAFLMIFAWTFLFSDFVWRDLVFHWLHLETMFVGAVALWCIISFLKPTLLVRLQSRGRP